MLKEWEKNKWENFRNKQKGEKISKEAKCVATLFMTTRIRN